MVGKLLFILVLLGIVGVGLVGWVKNVVMLFHSSFDPLTGVVVLRAIGVIVAPLGAVLGFC